MLFKVIFLKDSKYYVSVALWNFPYCCPTRPHSLNQWCELGAGLSVCWIKGWSGLIWKPSLKTMFVFAVLFSATEIIYFSLNPKYELYNWESISNYRQKPPNEIWDLSVCIEYCHVLTVWAAVCTCARTSVACWMRIGECMFVSYSKTGI